MPPPPTPTIQDVARAAGVSIATVSRVINGSDKVVAETAERVRSAISSLHYVPRTAARVLASRRTNTIGLILSEIGGAFFPLLLKGIEAEARLAGYEILIHSTQGQSQQRKPLGEQNTDGLLVFTSSLPDEELVRLARLDFPLLLLHQNPPPGTHIPMITVENKDGARMLVNHLIERHGRRRIAFLRGPQDHQDSYWRERGYREALAAHGLAVDPRLIVTGGFDDDIAWAAVRKMLEEGIAIDAVFAGDDDAAMGVYRALRAAGRSIPDEIAVVGFDDVPFAEYISPALTTIRAPIEQVGRAAVHQLINRIRSQPCQAETLLPTTLVIRQSCGCTG